MKILAVIKYENSFEMKIPDGLTDECISNLILNEDEYLGGNWSTDWKEIERKEDNDEIC